MQYKIKDHRNMAQPRQYLNLPHLLGSCGRGPCDDLGSDVGYMRADTQLLRGRPFRARCLLTCLK